LAGQYTQVKTPFDQDDFVTSFTPLAEFITDDTIYMPFCHAMVDTVPPPLESGSIHFPAKPGISSWPATGWVEEVVNGAKVPVGSAGGNITGGSVADERVADGSVVGNKVGGDDVANRAVPNGAMVALGLRRRELHVAMITIPATAPINTSQYFPCVSIYLLHFQKQRCISTSVIKV
jgi:hypothetical protein